MGVNPIQYLIIPRIMAAIITMPMLTLVFDAIGMIGSWIVGVELLGIDQGMFMSRIVEYVDYQDLGVGLVKATFFGFILSAVGCYKGFTTSGGAEASAGPRPTRWSSRPLVSWWRITSSLMF